MTTTENNTEPVETEEVTTKSRHQSGAPADPAATGTPTATGTGTKPQDSRHQSSEPAD